MFNHPWRDEAAHSCYHAKWNQPHSTQPGERMPSVSVPEPPEATGHQPNPWLLLYLQSLPPEAPGGKGPAFRGTAPLVPFFVPVGAGPA